MIMKKFDYLDKLREVLWALKNADYSERESHEDLRRATILEFEQQLEVMQRMLKNTEEEFAKQQKVIRIKPYKVNNLRVMTREEIKKGKKVWYRPFEGAEPRPAEIVSDEVRNVCGTDCAFIDTVSGCVDIEFLSPRD